MEILLQEIVSLTVKSGLKTLLTARYIHFVRETMNRWYDSDSI